MKEPIDVYLQYEKEVSEAKIKIIDRLLKNEQKQPKKRTSQVDVAWDVLKSAGRPLHVSEIIEIAKQNFAEDLERDSIVSAMLKKAKSGRMFIKTAPNTFAAIQA